MDRQPSHITKVLVANRSEIAIRIFRAATELGLGTVAIYSREDRFALHRFKADEAYQVGSDQEPVRAYLGIDEILRVARECGADAIHPGYGFLAENPELAAACEREGIAWIGPPVKVMENLGNKVAARNMAEAAGVPVMPATGVLPDDDEKILELADEVGFPVMVKASWGGGGRGMRVVRDRDALIEEVGAGRREAKAAFGSDEVFLEKLVENAWHLEVQVLGDTQGNITHLWERDCTVQRRHQKVVEQAPSSRLTLEQRTELCEAAVRLAREAGYVNAGTVEFLMDADTGKFYFIEVNPRIQVEHTVTEVVTGIDIVKAQIRIAQGAVLGTPESGVPPQDEITTNGYAMQCRITTEDPEHNFTPDYGRISAYRGATGFGIRLDGGTAYSGAVITPFYDSLLEKVTAWAPTPAETIARMDRALREFRIRGVTTNLNFVEAVVNHPRFLAGSYNTRFIDETPELFSFRPRRDRATRMLRFLGETIINGNPEMEGRTPPAIQVDPVVPPVPDLLDEPEGSRSVLRAEGPEGLSRWMREQDRLLLTDTTMRDAHQSLIATRLRTYDIVQIVQAYQRLTPGMFSLECWGGATFDVAMRFLKEDPWDRLAQIRELAPNLLLQMLLRASNAVGYTNYPDNAVQFFVNQASQAGVDVFRVFDSLNWVENMRVAMDAVNHAGAVCEAAICYSGDLLDPGEDKYTLGYYVDMAKELEAAGAHILGIKDMAGLCKPEAARRLVTALREEVGIPIHFHTHDTSGIAGASVLAAAEAGVDAADAAMDAMSGLTSQPNLGSICEALRNTERDTGIPRSGLAGINTYWEGVRHQYAPFESDMRSGASEVYAHEMPGGQYTNLRQQARALGIEARWPEVAKAYENVNTMFGDIVKVTPTSKVVGDLAVYMVTNDLTPDDILNPDKEIAFPQSVIEYFKGDLGQPMGGFPKELQRKVLKGERPIAGRPGEILEPVDFNATRMELEEKIGHAASDQELASYLMYPQVFLDYAEHYRVYGDVSGLPTPVFFQGLQRQQELMVDIEKGKTLVIRHLSVSDPDAEGRRLVFFELNGQPRDVKIADRSAATTGEQVRFADEGNDSHVAAPMPGLVVKVSAQVGDTVAKGDRLLSIEAMKMETAVFAEHGGTVTEVLVAAGTQVTTKELMMIIEP